MKKILILSLFFLATIVSCKKEQELGAPTGLFRLRLSEENVTVTTSSIKVWWSKYINHESYELIISDSTTTLCEEHFRDTVYTAEKSYTFENLESDTEYKIWIRALNKTYGICSEYTSWAPISTEAEL